MSSHQKKWILLLLFSMILLLSGCWNKQEPERMLYVHGMGIDYKDGMFVVHVQIINFENSAKKEQPSTTNVQAEVGTASGKTVDDALFEIYHSADQRIYWGHLTYMVFSEEALKQGGANSAIDNFIRYPDTRYQILLYATKDSVQEILLTTPVINSALILSKLGDPRNSFKQESFIEPTTVRTLIIGLNEPSHEAKIPYIEIRDNWETVDGGNTMTSLLGVSILSKYGFKGILKHEQVKGLQWMNDKMKRGEVSIPAKEPNESGHSVIVEQVDVQKKPTIKGDNITFNIAVRMEINVSSIDGKISYKELREGIEKQVKEEILYTYQSALQMDVDIYRLSETLYRNHLKVWKRLEKDGKIPLNEKSIRVDVEIEKFKSGRKALVETIKQEEEANSNLSK